MLFFYHFSSSKKLHTFTENPKNLPLEPPVGEPMAGLSINKHPLAFCDAFQELRLQLPWMEAIPEIRWVRRGWVPGNGNSASLIVQ